MTAQHRSLESRMIQDTTKHTKDEEFNHRGVCIVVLPVNIDAVASLKKGSLAVKRFPPLVAAHAAL
jgi:hypothetical protein